MGSMYKVPPLFAAFLFCDVIADKAHLQYYGKLTYTVYSRVSKADIRQPHIMLC